MDAVWPCVQRISLWLGISLFFVQPGVGQERALETGGASVASIQETASIERGTFLQVELAEHVNWKHVAHNSRVEGRLLLPVFAGREAVIANGTKIELTIDSAKKSDGTGKWKKAGNAVVRAFNPLERSRPAEYVIRLSKAELEGPQGRVAVAATALRAGSTAMIEMRTGTRNRGKSGGAQTSREKAAGAAKSHQTVLLQLNEGLQWPVPEVHRSQSADGAEKRKAHAFLLTRLSASQSKEGDPFQARLAEPVSFGEQKFEADSLLEGTVSRSTPPRMLSRAGALHLRIERITSPAGISIATSGTLAGVEAGAGSKYALDEEGGLRGLKPGLANALVDLSIAYALGKVTDDIAETPIRAVGAAMSDAAVANAARYFGLGASAVFLVTRHGRDVRLPQYSEIEVDFGRSAEPKSPSAVLGRP
jgi:hypothetical protein